MHRCFPGIRLSIEFAHFCIISCPKEWYIGSNSDKLCIYWEIAVLWIRQFCAFYLHTVLLHFVRRRRREFFFKSYVCWRYSCIIFCLHYSTILPCRHYLSVEGRLCMIYSGLKERGFFLQRGVLENRSYNAASQASNCSSE